MFVLWLYVTVICALLSFVVSILGMLFQFHAVAGQNCMLARWWWFWALVIPAGYVYGLRRIVSTKLTTVVPLTMAGTLASLAVLIPYWSYTFGDCSLMH